MLRLALVVLAPAVALGAAEGILRLAGYGYPTGFFIGPDASGALTPNLRFGWRFFPRSLARLPSPAAMPAAKPAGTCRIFILGSSAAMGWPDQSFSFGRILEVMLRERYPGVRFEVINTGMAAINSNVIAEIARDCAARRPDLFIIYMGNNEVVGPYGPGTVFHRWTPSRAAIRAGLWAKSTALGQLMADLAGRLSSDADVPPDWGGMRMFIEHRVAADDPRLPTMYANFRENLADICRTARRAGAPVVLSTLAVNLRDCSPFASLHRPDLSPEDLAQWEPLFAAGAGLQATLQWDAATQEYQAAARIDDRYAELRYRLGRCLAETGRHDEARREFAAARDLDALRFRADSRTNQIIREAEGVTLVDAERVFQENDPAGGGVPGEELFYDHVHMTFDGNYLLARAVLEAAAERLPASFRERAPAPAPPATRDLCAERLALTVWDRYRIAVEIMKFTGVPPFTDQYDHLERRAGMYEALDALERGLTPEALTQAARTYEAAIRASPDDWQLRNNFGWLELNRGRDDAAIAAWRSSLAVFPRQPGNYANIANLLAKRGRTAEAVEQYEKVLELDPEPALAEAVRKGLRDCRARMAAERQ